MSQFTKLVYNGVDLGLIRTIKIEQRAKYDPHGVDVLYIENRFTIQSVISELDETELDPLPPAAPGDTPAGAMVRIRHMLLSPRKHFKYTAQSSGGTITLLEAVGKPNNDVIGILGGTEANNGPKPISLDITNVSPRTWIIHYVIDVCVQDCNVSQHFASNRYEQTHDIDNKGMSKYTRMGKVFVRTDMNITPDGLRELVTPPVPPGFKRASMYQLSEDGLSMFYRIVDTEFFLGPPPGACEATGRFSVTAAPPGGVLWAQVDVSLTGWKKTPKRQLMQMAVAMALDRITKGGIITQNGKVMVAGGAMNEELFENTVSVQLRGMIGNSQLPQTKSGAESAGYGAWWGAAIGFGAYSGNTFGFSDGSIGASAAQAAQSALDAAVTALPGADSIVIDAMSDRFGVDMRWGPGEGQVCNQRDIVWNGVNGNDQFLVMLAAAMRDPCVADTFFSGTSTNLNGKTQTGPNEDTAIEYGDPIGIMKTSSTQQAALKTEGHSRLLQDFIAGANGVQEFLANVFGQRDGIGSEGSRNTALNWMAGRICQLDMSGQGRLGVGRLTVERVAVLQDVSGAAPRVEDIGWYEAWAVAVTHDTNYNQCALPATVEGYPAVRVQWANPFRTVTFRWSVMKHRVPPDVPLLVGDENAVVLKHEISLPNVVINGGEPCFECRGETVYQMLNERYAEFHYPVPPWLKVPMRRTIGPGFDPNYALTGGAVGAAQDAIVGPILAERWRPRNPGGNDIIFGPDFQSNEPPLAPPNP